MISSIVHRSDIVNGVCLVGILLIGVIGVVPVIWLIWFFSSGNMAVHISVYGLFSVGGPRMCALHPSMGVVCGIVVFPLCWVCASGVCYLPSQCVLFVSCDCGVGPEYCCF